MVLEAHRNGRDAPWRKANDHDSRTYQEVLAALQRARGEHADYVSYLEERYFSRY